MVLSGGCESFRQLVSQYDWNINIAMAVMEAESTSNDIHCNPNAYNGKNSNGSNDAGLFQINSIHVDSGLISDKARFNPEANVKAAFAIYKGGGWKPWASYNTGKHLKFLK